MNKKIVLVVVAAVVAAVVVVVVLLVVPHVFFQNYGARQQPKRHPTTANGSLPSDVDTALLNPWKQPCLPFPSVFKVIVVLVSMLLAF